LPKGLRGYFLDYLSQIADSRLSPQEVRQIDMIQYLGYMSAEFIAISFMDRLDRKQLLALDISEKQDTGVLASQSCTRAIYP